MVQVVVVQCVHAPRPVNVQQHRDALAMGMCTVISIRVCSIVTAIITIIIIITTMPRLWQLATQAPLPPHGFPTRVRTITQIQARIVTVTVTVTVMDLAMHMDMDQDQDQEQDQDMDMPSRAPI